MKKPCDGFIFFMTLCTITVITLLLITCMQHLLLYQKAINMQEQRHQNFYQLEKLATQLLNDSRFIKNCMQEGDFANQVLHRLLHHKTGCSLNMGKIHYQYIIEDLGVFPCLIVYKNQQKRASYHTRISIAALEENKNNTQILQLRYIKAAEPAECLGKPREIKLGISSWRFMPNHFS